MFFRGKEDPQASVADGETSFGKSEFGDVPLDVEREAELNVKLDTFNKEHQNDPNLPDRLLEDVKDVAQAHDLQGELQIEHVIIENSPYPEVRAAVRNYDQGGPANTVRAWVLGLLLVTISSALNSLFFLRYPSFALSSLICQLIAYPLGRAWAAWLPNWKFTWFSGTKFQLKWQLNPGPFNMKEHTVITVMANCALSGPVCTVPNPTRWITRLRRGSLHDIFSALSNHSS